VLDAEEDGWIIIECVSVTLIEIVPNLVEGGRAAVLKPGSLRESSKSLTP